MNWEFSDLRIAVIGDHNLDIDYVGNYTGMMSRERESLAIFESQPEEVFYSGGGAANIADYLASFGVTCHAIGTASSKDPMSHILHKIMVNNSKIVPCLYEGGNTPVFIKYYRPSGIHVFRANLASQQLSEDVESQIIEGIVSSIPSNRYDLILVADYDETGKGVITDNILMTIRRVATCPLVGISRKRSRRFLDFDVMILNHHELQQSLSGQDDDEAQNVRDLGNKIFAKNFVITQEGKGAVWYKQKKSYVNGVEDRTQLGRFDYFDYGSECIESKELIDPIDTCGCGDAFTAAFCAVIARADRGIKEAIMVGNAAGRAQARKLYGARELSLNEVIAEWNDIYDNKTLELRK